MQKVDPALCRKHRGQPSKRIFSDFVAMQQKNVDSILRKRYCALHQMHKRIAQVD
jgi:hypothetical protein